MPGQLIYPSYGPGNNLVHELWVDRRVPEWHMPCFSDTWLSLEWSDLSAAEGEAPGGQKLVFLMPSGLRGDIQMALYHQKYLLLGSAKAHGAVYHQGGEEGHVGWQLVALVLAWEFPVSLYALDVSELFA